MRDLSRLMSAASRARYDVYTHGKSLSFLRKTGSHSLYNKLHQGSAASIVNGSAHDVYNSYDTRMSDFGDVALTQTKPKKSGITAIDQYYEGIDPTKEIEYMRYQSEFIRLVTKIHNHWRAKKFPMCE